VLKNKKILTTVILSAFFATSVYAESTIPWEKVWAKADTNNDGKLNSTEVVTFTHAQMYPGFQPYMASHFSKYDFNNDGELSMEECHKGMAELDHSDGQVTQEFNRDYYGFRALVEK
jgi:Ca2+-binding EF-hand superfamily protein